MRALALLALPVLLPARGALAAEGESSLAVAADFAALLVDQGTAARSLERTGDGVVLVLDYQRGFGDSFWVRAGAGGGPVWVSGRAAGVVVATAGLTYAVDVLKYVPYVGLGAGAVLSVGGALKTQIDPVLDLSVGIEVQEAPTFAWGVEAHLASFATKTTVFMAGPRFAWKWGYF